MKISSNSYHRYCPLALWITSNSFQAISTHHTVSAFSQSQHHQHQRVQHRNFGSTAPSSSADIRSNFVLQESYRSIFTRRERILSSTKSMSTTSDDDNMTTPEQENHLRVALCQFLVTEDKSLNLQTCSSYIDQAVSSSTSSKVDLVVLPEIWNSPYATAAFSEYAEPVPNVAVDDEANVIFSPDDSPSVTLLQQKAIQHQIYLVGGSIPEVDHDNQLYNTCIVVNPQGQIIAKHRKVHLFDINVPNGITFRESDTLSSGTQITSFATPWCNIGIGICYDIRFSEYAMLLGQTCQILIYPGAFNLVTGPAHWELLQRARAVDTQCYVLTASPARRVATVDTDVVENNSKYPPYSAWGHSTVVAPWGDIIATTDEKESIVVADIDLTKVTTMRQSIPVQNQKRTDIYTLEKKSYSINPFS
jgi:omega-amidase